LKSKLVSLQEIAKLKIVDNAQLKQANSDYTALKKSIHDLQVEYKLLTVE
jgi:hypothetical protein